VHGYKAQDLRGAEGRRPIRRRQSAAITFRGRNPKWSAASRSRMTITTNGGESHSTRVDVPQGDPRDLLTEEEIAGKFTALGGDVIGKDQCKKLQSFIMSLEKADHLSGLFELSTVR
jgi:2-methylcitrate dehydratase PrpD